MGSAFSESLKFRRWTTSNGFSNAKTFDILASGGSQTAQCLHDNHIVDKCRMMGPQLMGCYGRADGGFYGVIEVSLEFLTIVTRRGNM